MMIASDNPAIFSGVDLGAKTERVNYQYLETVRRIVRSNTSTRQVGDALPAYGVLPEDVLQWIVDSSLETLHSAAKCGQLLLGLRVSNASRLLNVSVSGAYDKEVFALNEAYFALAHAAVRAGLPGQLLLALPADLFAGLRQMTVFRAREVSRFPSLLVSLRAASASQLTALADGGQHARAYSALVQHLPANLSNPLSLS